ncbi:hypothetical protein [Rhizosphaericola mali]|uniref:Uncharacterized protein n=1 Tax=Rhizosphaericola mali TaxID=2545455 RepID=A0A5P2G7Q7_9BACT|nr:hypothetical protein [Rhizosphaericola mali]QES89962.1 hypothetical protein E0W69_015275 [Rhizosphaericola mali]
MNLKEIIFFLFSFFTAISSYSQRSGPNRTFDSGSIIVVNDSVKRLTPLSKITFDLDSISTGEIAVEKMDPNAINSFFQYISNTKKTKGIKWISNKAYYNLAVLMARYKNYPLALKYFSLASAFDDASMSNEKFHNSFDSSFLEFPTEHFSEDSVEKNAAFVFGNDTILLRNKSRDVRSKTITNRKLLAPFKDDEEGLAYGIMLHLKQPEFGKRKQFGLINNVGHMFITLVKFEPNGKSVSRTFGFYPDKDNFLSATPLMPGTSSTFKNDSLHLWDETVGKFISYKQFKLIIKMVRQYSRKKYHLNKNNCTDFGLCIAAISGIEIQDTKGTWPLGHGNDPGDTGQSILEGKVTNAENSSKLFICTSPGDIKK